MSEAREAEEPASEAEEEDELPLRRPEMEARERVRECAAGVLSSAGVLNAAGWREGVAGMGVKMVEVVREGRAGVLAPGWREAGVGVLKEARERLRGVLGTLGNVGVLLVLGEGGTLLGERGGVSKSGISPVNSSTR